MALKKHGLSGLNFCYMALRKEMEDPKKKMIWSNYSDLTRPISPKWWWIVREMGPLISGKSRLVKYYNLARMMSPWRWNMIFPWFSCFFVVLSVTCFEKPGWPFGKFVRGLLHSMEAPHWWKHSGKRKNGGPTSYPYSKSNVSVI